MDKIPGDHTDKINPTTGLNPGFRNPGFVTIPNCDFRHGQINAKMDEILWVLKGDPKDPKDGGIIGEMRDQRRDKRWIYAFLTLIGIPSLFLFIKWILTGGV